MYTTLNYDTLQVQLFANCEAVAENFEINAETLRRKLRESVINSVRIGNILIEKKTLIKSKKMVEFAKRKQSCLSLPNKTNK